MEFLSCGFEGRALLFADDTDVAVDGSTRSKSKTPVNKWGGEGAVDIIGLIEPLLPNTRGNSFLGDQCLGRNGNVAKDHSCNSVQAASAITPNALMELGTSSPEPPVPAKRAKITNPQPPLPTCQVFGCNKDLSSSKDYHKRHKVCDVHSKTAVVIVNGIRQRFCQQCSRFHILAEFDEGKRSCRKRLAGHNERRRKPQLNTHLGSTYFTADASNSLIFSRILPGGFFGLQCNEAADYSRRVKLKEEPRRASQLAVDVKLSQSVLRFHGTGKQYPSKNCLNAPSSLPELYSSSDSGSALSLLSARKQDLGMSTAHSLVSTGNHHHAYNLFTAQNSAPILGESSSNNFAPVAYRSNGDAKVAVDSEISSTEPNTVKLDSSLSPQGANTVDLLELSLHLQRVEQQKYFGQIKMENDIFCDSTIA